MNGNSSLSKIQLALITSLVTSVVKSRQQITICGAGKNELYLECDIGPYSVFLYDDGFEIQSTDVDLRFEEEDIESIDDAKNKMQSALEEFLSV